MAKLTHSILAKGQYSAASKDRVVDKNQYSAGGRYSYLPMRYDKVRVFFRLLMDELDEYFQMDEKNYEGRADKLAQIRQSQRERDLHLTVAVSDVNYEFCQFCDGTGRIPKDRSNRGVTYCEMKDCPICDGRGHIGED